MQVRLQRDQLAALDAWIAKQDDPKPSRPEALRVIANEVLATEEHRDLAGRMALTVGRAEMLGEVIEAFDKSFVDADDYLAADPGGADFEAMRKLILLMNEGRQRVKDRLLAMRDEMDDEGTLLRDEIGQLRPSHR